MKGFTNFTKEAYSGLSNLENGMNSLVNATEQSKAKQRLVDSQKYQLQESYKSDLQDFLGALPMDTNQESYQSKATEFTSGWRSKINESAYDRQTISWMNGEFLPAKKEAIVGAVNIAKDISTDVQTATYAKNFGILKGSDRSLSYEQAVSEYKSYYDQIKLNGVPLEYGIVTPDEYARTIVGTKVLQSFQNDADKNLGNIDWNTEKAISDALSHHSDTLTPDERTQITNNAYQYLDVADSRRVQKAKEEAVRYNQALDQAIDGKVYCDVKEIQTYINNTPYRYSLEARSVRNKMDTYNDSITFNLQRKSYISKGTLVSSTVLSSLKDEDLAIGLMAEQLEGQAYKGIQNGYSATDAYLSIGKADFWNDFDDALVSQAKQHAQANLASKMQSQIAREKQIATADGKKVTTKTQATSTSSVSKVSEPIADNSETFPTSKVRADSEEQSQRSAEDGKVEPQIPVLPLLTETELEALQELQTENANLGNVKSETIEKANPVILDTFVAKKLAPWGLKMVESKGIDEAFKTIDRIDSNAFSSVLEDVGQSEPTVSGLIPISSNALGYAKTLIIQEMMRQEAEAKKAKHDATLSLVSQLRGDRYYAAHPDELKTKVNEWVMQGVLSLEEGTKNSSVYGFVNSGTYPTIMSQISSLAKDWGGTESERSRIKGQLDRWLANEFAENPDLYDDDAAVESIQKRLSDFAREKYGNAQLKTLQDVSKKFEDNEGTNLLQGLKDGSNRTILNKIASGEMDIFINNTAQTNLELTKDGTVAFDWIRKSPDELRDFFSKQLGFADQYKDLPDNAGGNYLKYVIESNVAFARTKASVINAFSDTFTKYNESPVNLDGCKMVWIGDSWAISDPEVQNLYWIPNLSASSKPTVVPWTWATMNTDENGAHDIRSLSYKGAISGFVPDARLKQDRAKLDASIASNTNFLNTKTLSGIEQTKTKGFITRDTQANEKLKAKEEEFFKQVIGARTAFAKGVSND